MATAKDNKYLTLWDTVKLTPVIEPVIIALDPFFKKHNVHSCVTSGLRTPQDQLGVIHDYLKKTGLDKKYPEAMENDVNAKFTWQGKEVYKWQPGWSALLNAKIIINPPIRCICLLDYINAAGVNRKGQIIEGSNHIPGNAFNIGGGKNGLNDEIAVIEDAKPHIPGIVSYVIERNNNALHVNCKVA